jgi:hypothetical protein
MSKTSITISSKHCERACVQALKRYISLLEKQKEDAISEEMTKKPYLWFFDKPAKTREQAIANIAKNNPWLGYGYETLIAQVQDILEMCSFSDEITLSQKDFNIIKIHMR